MPSTQAVSEGRHWSPFSASRSCSTASSLPTQPFISPNHPRPSRRAIGGISVGASRSGKRLDFSLTAASNITQNFVNGWSFWECRLPGESTMESHGVVARQVKVSWVSAQVHRPTARSLDRCPVLSTVVRVDQVSPPNFSLARFSCSFHVDTRTVIYVDYDIAVSTCIWRRERDSNPRRAFDPYTLSRVSMMGPGRLTKRRPPLGRTTKHHDYRRSSSRDSRRLM